MTMLPVPATHVPTLSKAVVRRSRNDSRTPSGRRGLARSGQPESFLRRISKAQVSSRLFKTRRKDPDIFAAMNRIRSRVPEWRIVEASGFEGQGNEAAKEGLEAIFHRPDGVNSYRQILAVTVDRFKGIGSAHWLLRRAGDVAEALNKRVDTFVNVLAEQGIPTAVVPMLSDALAKAVEDRIGSLDMGDVVGFEWLQGYIERKQEDLSVFVQTVGGSTPREKEHPAEDIVEFLRMDPEHGGPLNALEAIEEWSDASIWAFMLNRDAARTGGMADLMLAIEGMSETERDRLEALMLERATPSQSDLTWIPIVMRLTSTFQGRAPVVHDVSLSKKDRDAQWLDWDEAIDKRKFGVWGVPAPIVKEYKTMNRATVDTLNKVFYDYEWWPLFRDINEPINDRIFVDEMGVMDWIHEFVEPDFRSTEERFKQDMEQLGAGIITPYNQFSDTNGQDEAERVFKELNRRGLDADAWKLPWFKTGKGWTPITTVIGQEGGLDENVEDALAQMVNDVVAQPDDDDDDDEAGTPSGDNGKATVEEVKKSLQVIDALQKSCVEAVREGVDPSTAWPDEWTVNDILPDALNKIDEGLTDVRTAQQVSDVFAPVRKELRTQLPG